MKYLLVRSAVFAAIPVFCFAVTTKTWISSTYLDFEKGELKGVSIRSDGRVSLAPKTSELFDSGLAYIWALAADSKGIVYAAGGPTARIFRFDSKKPGAKPEKIAELDGTEIHALVIDKQDRLYAATFPDGKIYRLDAAGKPEEFYSPNRKYIWSMLFDTAGNLLVATGDTGEIHKVAPDGKGSVFFRSEDTHVRALAWAGSDLIAGTDPSGLVIRIRPDGQAFVLHQIPKREVTALAIGPDGSIYAAGAGSQQPAGAPSAISSLLPAPPAPASPTGGGVIVVGPPTAAPASEPERPAPRIAVTGGSEVIRIFPSGQPQKIWSHPRDVVYSISFDGSGAPVLGTGNKGVIYRVDSPSLYTALATLGANQTTVMLRSGDGSLLAATGNLGKVFKLGPGLETEGTVTSEVFDSGSFSTWGRLMPYGNAVQDGVRLESHSGNLDRPRSFWSAWSAAPPPPARFTQWRATLRSVNGISPELDSIEQAYLSRNVAPRVEEIEATPPNYRFAAVSTVSPAARAPQTISLPAMGHHATSSAFSPETDSVAMTFAKGWIGLRWAATDENSDPLSFNLEIRGVKEIAWNPLREKLTDRHYSFDSTAFPDGEYIIRVTASDEPGNTAGEALTGRLDSPPILIDNTPPAIGGLTAKRSDAFEASWKATDALNVIKRAEYSLDGGEWILVEPVSKLSDSESLSYSLRIPNVSPGEHTIAVRVTDDYDNSAVEKVTTVK